MTQGLSGEDDILVPVMIMMIWKMVISYLCTCCVIHHDQIFHSCSPPLYCFPRVLYEVLEYALGEGCPELNHIPNIYI